MRLFYTLGIWCYTAALRTAALLGHEKARQMVDGWKEVPAALGRLTKEKRTVWFHAASLGEFEQARPLIEAYRQRHGEVQVVVTFFSPSGYEVRKNYTLADAVCYLPMDTPRNARRFVEAVHPQMAFFVKYEFWYNYLDALKKNGTDTYLFSAIFRPGQYFFSWYGRWFCRQLARCFKHIFVQNDESLRLLTGHGIGQCSIAGDTRFDRVHQIAVAAEGNATVEKFLQGADGTVVVAGSTWPPDEQLIAAWHTHQSACRIVLAPHVISEDHLRQIETLFPHNIRYSRLAAHTTAETDHAAHTTTRPNVLIIDNIGLLSKLYRYADVAYIGGGFGVGIHNILEAVTFGKPVLFGPNYHKFQEACDIIACGGGWSVNKQSTPGGPAADPDPLAQLTTLLSHPEALKKASLACTGYMSQNLGSTDKILQTIEK